MSMRKGSYLFRDSKTVAEIMNNHFSNIAKQLTRDTSNIQHYASYNHKTNNHTKTSNSAT